MTPNPIHRVLSVLLTSDVRFLLMGGQACVLYGGAEFSRDTDIAILPRKENLEALQKALAALKANPIAVPPCTMENLQKGHAAHFRCNDDRAAGIRLDVMSTMRGVEPFERLWERRTTVELESGLTVDLLSLPDLVKAKKTQHDKDWPMIRRLIEADFESCAGSPSQNQVDFWLLEARSPELLQKLCRDYPQRCSDLAAKRAILRTVRDGTDEHVQEALRSEEESQRKADREYWQPLQRELERMRHGES